jgi:DNA modification methylase
MKISLWPLARVKPYERNPRKNAGAIDAVAASLKEFGFQKPIVVDQGGVIVCGHTTFFAATKLELPRVPVKVASELSPEQVRAYRIADNKTGELAEWDLDLLAAELQELAECNYELGLLAFDADELAKLLNGDLAVGLTDPDDVPAPPDRATTQPGELWILGNHRLLCGDSSQAADVDRLLAGERVQLVNTDPPYNVKVEPRSNNAIAAGLSSFGGTHHQGLDLARDPKKGKRTTKQLRAKDRPLANDFVSPQAFDHLLAAWFGNMARVLEPGRGFYIWGGFSNCGNYPAPLKAAGLYFSQAIIWVKNQPVLTRKDFMTTHEWCFYGWREGAAHLWLGPRNIRDVWQPELRRATKNGQPVVLIEVAPEAEAELPLDVWRVKKVAAQKMVHLTEKPVELATRAMQYSSRPGERVLDLFGGSGSTLIAAEQAGRHARLVELDPLYCDVIIKRWEAFTGQKAKCEKARGDGDAAKPKRRKKAAA